MMAGQVSRMSVQDLAPIAIFAYKRTTHLQRTLASLKACPEFAKSPVFVFSDGPKDASDAADVAKVRKFLHDHRSNNFTIIEAPTNRGLAASIIAGTTQLCNEFGRVIIVEDDLVVSPFMLTWMNRGLQHYESEPKVWQISADQFVVPEFKDRTEGVFLEIMSSWGWATWKRAWDNFDAKATDWETVKTDPDVAFRFDHGGACLFTEMLLAQMSGQSDSWAIRWEWSAFRAGAIALHPPQPLVRNIGHDATATHTRFRYLRRLVPREFLRKYVNAENATNNHKLCPTFPTDVRVVPELQDAVMRAIRDSRRMSSRVRRAFFEP
jgi:hypothetical protein